MKREEKPKPEPRIVIWKNPYPKGTEEARIESVRVVKEATNAR
jgi:hypothetical protein